MHNMLLSLAIVVWFLLAYPMARHHLATVTAPQNVPLPVPMTLVAVFAFMPLVFVVPRTDGNAVLEEGLTASNIVTLVLTGLTGLYLAVKVVMDRRILLVPFSMPYLPFTLMIAVNGLSTLWSIVPAYTAYRTVELGIFYLASILIFDRSDIERRLADLLAIFVVVWLVAVAPIIAESLASGIVFSAAKNNMMPLVCAALGLLVAFDPRAPRRAAYLLLALIGFIIAGSAASTGALVAVVPGLMIASPHRRIRILGGVTAALVVAAFLVLMLGLSAFPALLDLLSALLQKPPDELANATGRGTFWPTFIKATQDHLVGSGFSAGDRFVQLLTSTTELAEELGRDAVFITSSHNMFLSAWAGTGIVGIGFAAVVLGTAIRWGMVLHLRHRRFIVTMVIFLALNGMTTPGIFQDWNVNVLGFVAMLAYCRIGALRRGREAGLAMVRTGGGPLRVAQAWHAS
ncbi:O-antigen ligase family protein [Methylobacterium nodulans]|uniref:O-antigen ligase-related domain-containing protein n=1 Tax=Methylobacterium nodulans (strain LMG 21967 / CNCM I-2342 / ORS 2060) TaxID=460265 RepID=B8IAG2_METNO|nr:O-antigen ligase family protein [Methylobacterium nodulans]ACL59225.1 conserved hypothetical protein [Methylobacterium nodulans ORS 2060]